MRKLFSLLLAVMLLFLFAACGTTNSNTGVGEEMKDSADNLMEDTKDKVEDFTDGMTEDDVNTPAEMPEDTIDGTMENTEENVNPGTVQ